MLARTLEDITTQVPIEVIDIDENQGVAMDYGIRGVPTMVMLEGNTEIKRISGVQTQNQIEAWLND
jgi:thioredoxin 1